MTRARRHPRKRPCPDRTSGERLRTIPLSELNLPAPPPLLPQPVRVFLLEAERRIEEFQRTIRVPGFVPSDFGRVYHVLEALAARDVAPGEMFCEWGSGFGVVACLAAMLGFQACGIEIEEQLVEAASLLAEDFDLPVEFHCGSFIPEGGEAYLDEDCDSASDGFAWLTRGRGSTQEELGLAADDFDIVFAYPWPDEECAVADLFQRYAAVGTVLATYHGGEDIRLRRKR